MINLLVKKKKKIIKNQREECLNTRNPPSHATVKSVMHFPLDESYLFCRPAVRHALGRKLDTLSGRRVTVADVVQLGSAR